ncbi:MAG: hypothetical protein ACKOX6_13295 [Bdellovibrio sp.]
MYKYEIEIVAGSMQELRSKMAKAAYELLNEVPVSGSQQTFVEPPPVPSASNLMPFPLVPPVATQSTSDYDEEVVSPEPAPVANFQAPTQQLEVDSRGLPWDARIHANTKATNKDGSWRIKRGTEPSLVTQVEQELIAKIKSGHVPVAAPAPTAFVPPPPAPTVPVNIPTFQAPPPVAAVAPVQATPAQDYSNVQVPQGVRPAYTLSAFKNNLTVLLASLIDQGKIDQAYIKQLEEYFRVKQIWNVTGDEKKSIELYQMFGSPEVGFITMVDEA